MAILLIVIIIIITIVRRYLRSVTNLKIHQLTPPQPKALLNNNTDRILFFNILLDTLESFASFDRTRHNLECGSTIFLDGG